MSDTLTRQLVIAATTAILTVASAYLGVDLLTGNALNTCIAQEIPAQ